MATDARAPLPLESGDHLTREEFHRRYCEHPEIKKAELIGGVVFVTPPARDWHGKAQGVTVTWLGNYAFVTADLRLSVSGTIFLGDDELQPDVFLYRTPAAPGGAFRREDGYIEGPPQLAMEIAASSASKDLHVKLRAYEEAGVAEYIVWSVLEPALYWFRLLDGRYVRIEPDADGLIASSAFPGLRLAVTKLLAGDYSTVMAVARQPAP